MTDGASEVKKVEAINDRPQWTRWAVLGLVCALVIGVYAWCANSGVWELLGSGAQDSYYNLLVQGFRDGHLNLKTEVPPGLTQLADPYDPSTNRPYWWNKGHSLLDMSYYKGKLYLYFGITPALVLFWPYAALTGYYLLHKDAGVIFFSAGFLVGAGLLLAAWRRYFAGVSFWIIVPCVIALGMANLAPAILARSDVYEVAISCGYAMTMLALAGIWKAMHQPQRCGLWLAAASLAYGLAVGARPSLLLGAIILLVPVIQARREKRRVWPLLLAASVPIVLIGLGLMLYNAMRFDNPLEFGQRYQLNAGRWGTVPQFNLHYFWFNFRLGFLEPAVWSGHFPFVNDILVPFMPKGASFEHPFGVLTNIPLVWLALAVPLAWRIQPAEMRSTLRRFLAAVALLFGASALTLCFHDSMCLRYEVEFTDTLVWLAVIGIIGLERALAGQPVWRRAARCGWGLLLIFSAAFNVLASFELHAFPRFELGDALTHLGRMDDAISQYQAALQINPDLAQAHNNLGNALLQKGRLDEAITHYERALQINPDFVQARNNLGNILLQTGRADEAITEYQQAVQTDPGSAAAHYDLGNALLQKGNLSEAIDQYQKALQIRPDYVEAHLNLGNILLQNRRVDEAITHFQQALQIKPGYAVVHYNLGNALRQKGRLDEAINQYQAALQIDPGYPGAHLNLGNALGQKGEAAEAITQFQQALQMEPANKEAQNNLAWVLATCPEASLRNGGKAVELARQANGLTGGENAIVLQTLAAAYAEDGRYSEAVETAQHALRVAAVESNTGLAGQIQAALKLYQAGRPYHGPEQTH